MHPENQAPYDILLSLLGRLEYQTRYGKAGAPNQKASTEAGAQKFAQTNHTVGGKFLKYWNEHGGLAQQGYPITDEFQEKSNLDGKTYTVQYFERAVFELHPENSQPNDVLLSLLGVFLYDREYPNGAPNQTTNSQPNSRLFTETGKRVGGVFLDYWTKSGGLAQQGVPISDEFDEVSVLDGKTYKVQYFQRSVFEYHPENQPPYDVLLSQLGTFRHRDRYIQASTPAPASPTAGAIPQPPEYAAVRAKFENLTPEQWKAAGYTTMDADCYPGIGYRVHNGTLFNEQYDSGKPDPMNPPTLFANGTQQRIIGLQWAVIHTTQPTPVLFGRTMWTVFPAGEPWLVLFSFFKPDGHVLFSLVDPMDPCKR
jgi:hypothetical protein